MRVARFACEYLAERAIRLTGSDGWGVGAVGAGFASEKPVPLGCHEKLQVS
jgi:hypothetical protein